MQLTLASDEVMMERAKQLIERVKLEQTDRLPKNEILNIIATIAIYSASGYYCDIVFSLPLSYHHFHLLGCTS